MGVLETFNPKLGAQSCLRTRSYGENFFPGGSQGHPPNRATPCEPAFPIFPYKTRRTVYMRNQEVSPVRGATHLAGATFLHINTLARQAGQNSDQVCSSSIDSSLLGQRCLLFPHTETLAKVDLAGRVTPRELLSKVLCGEAPPRGPTPFFGRKGTAFVHLSMSNGIPFTYLVYNLAFLLFA